MLRFPVRLSPSTVKLFDAEAVPTVVLNPDKELGEALIKGMAGVQLFV